MSNVVTLPSIFFGGLFANSSTMVKGVGWIQYLSPIRYAFEAMLRAEYENTYFSFIVARFDMNLGYWGCIGGLIGLSILSRLLSLWILNANVKYIA